MFLFFTYICFRKRILEMKKLLLIVGFIAFLVFIISFLTRCQFPLVSMQGFFLDIVWMVSFAIACLIGCNITDDDYSGYFFN